MSRPRLLQQLETGLAGTLTLIAAPAGFDKSTLLSDWIGEAEAPRTERSEREHHPFFCWLSLEENDNDPSRFWLYFMAALQSKNPSLSADTPSLLQSPDPPPLETILTILLNDLNYTLAALHGSSYYQLPRLLQWFTGNIGFHHIHHLSPRIPNYHLQRCHDQNPAFQQVVHLTLKSSFQTAWLTLWRERERRLVSLRENIPARYCTGLPERHRRPATIRPYGFRRLV